MDLLAGEDLFGNAVIAVVKYNMSQVSLKLVGGVLIEFWVFFTLD